MGQKNIPSRVVIHPRDIENITGRKGRTARHLLKTIREAYGKPRHQFITVYEFCKFTGIAEDHVRQFMHL